MFNFQKLKQHVKVIWFINYKAFYKKLFCRSLHILIERPYIYNSYTIEINVSYKCLYISLSYNLKICMSGHIFPTILIIFTLFIES